MQSSKQPHKWRRLICNVLEKLIVPSTTRTLNPENQIHIHES